MFAPPVLTLVLLYILITSFDLKSDPGWGFWPTVGGVFFLTVFFLALPWASKKCESIVASCGLAAGVTLLVCLGWFLLGLGILYAMCGISRGF